MYFICKITILTNKSQRNLQNILAIQKIFANSIDFENKCWYT